MGTERERERITVTERNMCVSERERVCDGGVCGSAAGRFLCLTMCVCVCVDGLCPEFPGKGGSHLRGGQETQTGLTSFSVPDGRPDNVLVCARAKVAFFIFGPFRYNPEWLFLASNSD